MSCAIWDVEYINLLFKHSYGSMFYRDYDQRADLLDEAKHCI